MGHFVTKKTVSSISIHLTLVIDTIAVVGSDDGESGSYSGGDADTNTDDDTDADTDTDLSPDGDRTSIQI